MVMQSSSSSSNGAAQRLLLAPSSSTSAPGLHRFSPTLPTACAVVDVANVVLRHSTSSSSSSGTNLTHGLQLLQNVVDGLITRYQPATATIYLVIANHRYNQWNLDEGRNRRAFLNASAQRAKLEWVYVPSPREEVGGEAVDDMVLRKALEWRCRHDEGELAIVTGDKFRDMFIVSGGERQGLYTAGRGGVSRALEVWREVERSGKTGRVLTPLNCDLESFYTDAMLVFGIESDNTVFFQPSTTKDGNILKKQLFARFVAML